MRFLHAADIHLGYRQYNLEARLEDFERGFDAAGKAAAGVDDRVGEPVDFFLLSGDLFDDRSIDARTYTQATRILSKLRERGVPVYVIEGNHDRAFHGDGMSWLEALDHRDLIELIRLKGDDDGDLEYMGDYRKVEVDGERARIYGARYSGAGTSSVAEAAAEEVRRQESRDPADLVILMMHFGIEGQGHAPGHSYNILKPLEEQVDYLALGHFHNRYELDDWVYNPGAPEATSVTHAPDDRGFYLYSDGEVEFLEHDGREFERIFVDVTEAKSPEEVYAAVREEAGESDGAVVDVTLSGELRFDRSTLTREGVEEALSGEPLQVMLKVKATRDELDVDTGGLESREAIEGKVFERVAREASLPEGSARAMAQLKELALDGAPGGEVVSTVETALDGGYGEPPGEGAPSPEDSEDRGSLAGDSGGDGAGDSSEAVMDASGSSVEEPAAEEDAGESGDEWNWRSSGAG